MTASVVPRELFVFITVLLNHCPRPSGTPGKQVLTAQEVVKRRKREVNDDANAGDSDRELRRQLLILMLMSPAILGAPDADRSCANHMT